MDLVWLGLAISFMVGLLYAFVLLGDILNPHNIGWLKGDSAGNYIAWD